MLHSEAHVSHRGPSIQKKPGKDANRASRTSVFSGSLSVEVPWLRGKRNLGGGCLEDGDRGDCLFKTDDPTAVLRQPNAGTFHLAFAGFPA